MNPTVESVTKRIEERSRRARRAYLSRMEAAVAGRKTPFRTDLAPSNLAHAYAASSGEARSRLLEGEAPNIAIISSYSELLSAHAPLARYPALLKEGVAEAGGVAQFAGGVPAMCDGVTQGYQGMDISLMTRDVIAMSVATALCHRLFDGMALLGVCDKIVPGLVMGALRFGHLPCIMVPGGPMTSGISNKEKARDRERFARCEISREEMVRCELGVYHGQGTCTFYGTANSNQLIMELLGLHLPGASFVNANTPLRDALTREAGRRLASITHLGPDYTPMARVVSEKAVVNALVGLLATGGSTNETLHLVAMARSAGIILDWRDFHELSQVVPLLVRIYPNGPGDINSFQAAGGTPVLIGELLELGLLHRDVTTVMGRGLEPYLHRPVLDGDGVRWEAGPHSTLDPDVISPASRPFDAMGGLRVLEGNLGRAIMKISALPRGEETVVEAPALVFNSQEEVEEAFRQGRLYRDHVTVVRFQGPRANGMPELHKLITLLSVTMDRGHQVGLVTDGRLSGASGKVPFAIHCTPEAAMGGPLARLRDGDTIRMDARAGVLEVKLSQEELLARSPEEPDLRPVQRGWGRELFAPLRRHLDRADAGASALFLDDPDLEV